MNATLLRLAVAGAVVVAPTFSLDAQTHDSVAVRHVVEAIAALTQTGDLAGLDTLWAQDPWVRIIEGAGVDRGWVGYRDHHLKPELEELENLSYRFWGVEPQVRGDVAWASFRYELGADVSEGHVAVEGRGTAVLEKRDRRWLVVHLHTSGRRKAQGG